MIVYLRLGVAGVDAQQVVHHSLQGWPNQKKKLSTDQQRKLLVKTNLVRPSDAEAADLNAHDLAKFFFWDREFQIYNKKRMTAHDPKAHKWCTAKKLLDYIPSRHKGGLAQRRGA